MKEVMRPGLVKTTVILSEAEDPVVLRRGGGAGDAVGNEVRAALLADSPDRRELDRYLIET